MYQAAPIKGFPDYLISNIGEVISMKKGFRVLRPSLCGKGYLGLTLHIDGKATPKLVHRLVAEAFIDNHENVLTVDHIDNVKTNNRVENLQWMSNAGNVNKARNSNLPLGVYRRHSGGFYAQRGVGGKVHSSKTLPTPEAASFWYRSFGESH